MVVDARSLIPLNPRDYLILLALASGERHGYGIVKEVEGGGVRVDPANLYRAIKRMLASGLVEETDGPQEELGGTERRKYYHLTALGRRVVALEAARLAELTRAARALELIPEVDRPT